MASSSHSWLAFRKKIAGSSPRSSASKPNNWSNRLRKPSMSCSHNRSSINKKRIFSTQKSTLPRIMDSLHGTHVLLYLGVSSCFAGKDIKAQLSEHTLSLRCSLCCEENNSSQLHKPTILVLIEFRHHNPKKCSLLYIGLHLTKAGVLVAYEVVPAHPPHDWFCFRKKAIILSLTKLGCSS
jgi:hypothetical protein